MFPRFKSSYKLLALSPSLALMLASLAVLLALFTLAPALLGGVR